MVEREGRMRESVEKLVKGMKDCGEGRLVQHNRAVLGAILEGRHLKNESLMLSTKEDVVEVKEELRTATPRSRDELMEKSPVAQDCLTISGGYLTPLSMPLTHL